MKKIIIISSVLVLLLVAFLIQDEQIKKETIKTKKDLKHNVIKDSKEESKITSNENVSKYNDTFKTNKENISIKSIPIEQKSDIEIEQEIFADIQTRMTIEMENIPSCLENASSKNEAIECSKKLDEVNEELELLLGIPTNDFTKRDLKSFEWNEEIKSKMIKELDDGILPMQELLSCLQEADTRDKRDGCYEVE